MNRDEKKQEISHWVETWTEINAIPGTMPEDESPCTDAINFKQLCIDAAKEEGYSEEDLIQFSDGDLAMYFDHAARRNFKIKSGR